MPGWDEASVDELLADPIVRDLMAADGVEPGELRALLYEVQRTIECYAATRGGLTTLAGFAKLCDSTPGVGPARSTLPANRGRADVRKTRIALADYSKLSMAPLEAVFGETRYGARS
jgi:hypothetical protein